MLVFVVYEEEEQDLEFAATLVYEDGARCYAGSSLSADLLFELCPMLEEWQEVRGTMSPKAGFAGIWESTPHCLSTKG